VLKKYSHYVQSRNKKKFYRFLGKKRKKAYHFFVRKEHKTFPNYLTWINHVDINDDLISLLKKHNTSVLFKLESTPAKEFVEFQIEINEQTSNHHSLKEMIHEMLTTKGFGISHHVTHSNLPSELACYIKLHAPVQVDEVTRNKLWEAVQEICDFFHIYDLSNPNPIYKEVLNLSKVTSIFPKNRIEMSEDTMIKYGLKDNSYIWVCNSHNGRIRKGKVKCVQGDFQGVRIISGILEELQISKNEMNFIWIQQCRQIGNTNKIQAQTVNKVSNNIVTLSRDLYEKLGDCEFVTFVNETTGSFFDISRNQIEMSQGEDSNTVKLNYLYRQFVDLEVPVMIEPYHVQKIISHENLTESDREFIEKTYGNRRVLQDVSFENKQNIRKILKKVDYFRVTMYPYKSSRLELKKQVSKRKRIWHFILKRLIDYNSASLRVVRPYVTDESTNVVRMTTTMLKMLGLENTDNVVITYRSRQVVARALEVDADSFEKIQNNNTMASQTEMEYSIGIPTHIRSQLDMEHIHCVCSVRRDMNYIFKKHAHLQVVPTIGIFFTVFQTFKDPLLRMVITAIGLLTALYVSFTVERNKISN
jgi:hypothetical protein